MTKAFASRADLEDKRVSFDRLSPHAYAYTAEGDPNTGIVVGDNAVLVADAQATPVMAQDVLGRIRGVTDLPVHYVVLTHYHAVRVLGASGYGAREIIASEDTYDLIVERGAQDMQSEMKSRAAVSRQQWPGGRRDPVANTGLDAKRKRECAGAQRNAAHSHQADNRDVEWAVHDAFLW